MNRWELTDEVKTKWISKIAEWLDKQRAMTVKEVESAGDEVFTLSLCDTELNPYTLGKVLCELGYEKGDMSHNGWEMGFLQDYENYDNECPAMCEKLCVHGCGMTFDLNLSISEFI